MDMLLWFEATAFSTWMRESGPAFFSSLILHSVGMGFVVGGSVATSLVVLGAAPRVPAPLMRSFVPIGRIALGMVTVSGVLLLAAYPTKALTNPVFYVKLCAVFAAVYVSARLNRHRSGPTEARVLAALSLALWTLAITSGRLLAYTYDVLLASHLR